MKTKKCKTGRREPCAVIPGTVEKEKRLEEDFLRMKSRPKRGAEKTERPAKERGTELGKNTEAPSPGRTNGENTEGNGL